MSKKQSKKPWEIPVEPDMRGRLITDPKDKRYMQIVPTMPDMTWLLGPNWKDKV